jgi:phosphate transport system substrate-binding protein
MQLFKWTRLLPLACCLLACLAFTEEPRDSGAKRIYVEPFTTKEGAEKLREEVTTELRKLKSVSLVSDAASADFVVGGGGEIWVKGYRSFSPRSHMKISANGTPLYGGFLSVELKDRKGVTVWSYLATPAAGSEDVSKDVAKRIAKHLAEAIILPEVTAAQSGTPKPVVALSGAGATFPYPVYQKWFTNFQTENPSATITYEPIGSEAGVHKLLDGDVDFAGSDSPEAIHQIAPHEEIRYLLFPSVVGAVVPIVNVPGVPADIALTPEALAGIFLGKITKWNDPVLTKANRGLELPNLDIVVVHRADGSGTSYAWTDYLSKTSPEWSTEVGSSLSPKWPAGRAATGNDGVAKLVKELGGSIGYVEFIYALKNHLTYGKVRNKNGEFVEASLEGIAAAVSHSPEIRDDFKGSIVDAPGEGAYPIASFTWIIVPAQITDDAKRSAITAFLKWMLGPGQRQAAALGYLALPGRIVAKEQAAIAGIH